jgi:hypothetical protein
MRVREDLCAQQASSHVGVQLQTAERERDNGRDRDRERVRESQRERESERDREKKRETEKERQRISQAWRKGTLFVACLRNILSEGSRKEKAATECVPGMEQRGTAE